MIGQCRHEGNLFCFFLPTRKKEEGKPTHIAHIAKPHEPTPKPKLVKEYNFADPQENSSFELCL